MARFQWLAGSFALLVLVAGCTTTQIAGADRIGYNNAGAARGGQIYICMTGSCGELAVAVHKTEALSGQDAENFDTAANTALGRKLVTIGLQQEANRHGDNVSIGRVTPTKIGAFSGLKAPLVFSSDDGDSANGAMIILRNDDTAEFFVVITEGARRANAEVRKLATVWSEEQ